MLEHVFDHIDVTPTLVGPHGRAWKVDIDEVYQRRGITREAEVAEWVVEAPWAHPVWHSYVLVVIHLRPMPGPAVKLFLDGATHEVWVLALDPDSSREKMITTGEMVPLRPMNFAAQIIEPSDDAAAARIEKTVRSICDGKLSPDTDFVASWAARFGDNMLLSPSSGG
jgi:hypothetical protein